LIFGVCVGISLVLGYHINGLIEKDIKLAKSINDKENYANILSGVKFYQEDDMFYIVFDKTLKTQQFKTENGEQAIGYRK
jgi:hypothetical protein